MLKLFDFLWLAENVFTLHGGGKGGGDAPDYTAGMIAMANASERSAKADLAFRTRQYEEAKPRLMQLYDMANKVGTAQYESMKASDQRAADQNKFWEDNYKPTELRSLAEANNYGGVEDQAIQAGKAVADVRQQSAIQQAGLERNLASMGINPNSAKFVAAKQAAGLSSAASAAGGATNARLQAKNQGIALRAGAVATGRGMQNVAGQTAATSLNQGNSAVNNSNTGAQGGLGYANFVGQGYQNQTQMHTGLFNGYANLQGQSNQINGQSDGGSGIMGLIGTGAMAVGTAM
jgi:hypothetical protein